MVNSYINYSWAFQKRMLHVTDKNLLLYPPYRTKFIACFHDIGTLMRSHNFHKF